MQSPSYESRRQQLTTYFDQTAAAAWKALTSDEPVNRIRQTVRAGRDEMRAHLLSLLPADMVGCRLLDAGCGTGALSVEAARRGATVVAIDVAENLIDVARKRQPADLDGNIDFRVGDMCSPALGDFDFVVAMDSLIHYESSDIVSTLESLCSRTQTALLFTFAPRTNALAAMHFVGRLIPQARHRAPSIVPVGESQLRKQIAGSQPMRDWQVGSCHRVSSGFYKSQAMELRRSCAS